MVARVVGFLCLVVALVGCQKETQVDLPAPTDEAGDVAVGPAEEEMTEVVFVCQFGYAKSLVSSHHFEVMVQERGLPVRVVARGMTPADQVPQPLVEALRQDGFEVSGYAPQVVSQAELAEADYVISFEDERPDTPAGVTELNWTDISMLDENYERARDEIIGRLVQLLDDIESNG
ncbi:MAG: hypothetical protein AAGI08_02140 [Bacteroidota bacterium]